MLTSSSLKLVLFSSLLVRLVPDILSIFATYDSLYPLEDMLSLSLAVSIIYLLSSFVDVQSTSYTILSG